MMTPCKIAVLTDIHYGEDHPNSNRRCSIGPILLERAVRRLNGLVKPDFVAVLGDLVDNGSSTGAEEKLAELKAILDKLNCPYLAIPGNHDDDIDQFYRIFDRPADYEDIGGVRFLTFVDRDEPGYNASRSEADLKRTLEARSGYNGPIVALQHVCLQPAEMKSTPYNYLNVDEVVGTMKDTGVSVSISGHHHRGAVPVEVDGTTYIIAPGLCEHPFPILEVVLTDSGVETRRHELAMPENLKLVDTHLHTQMAYCSENMDVKTAISLAKEFGLAGLRFTEHSGQLYYDRKPYWRGEWVENAVDTLDPAFNRIGDYLALKEMYEDEFTSFSSEVDCAGNGTLVIKPDDRKYFPQIVGAVHVLPGLSKEEPPSATSNDRFLFMVESMCKQGIASLAHPMRIFGRSGWGVPDALFEPTARLLKQYGVAAEINYHTNQPPVDFVRLCLEYGLKFTFASDAHHLAEIGDFAPHLAILKAAGFDGDLKEIILPLQVGSKG